MIPVATAVAVGVLYTLGALYKAAQLHGAGLSVDDTLPLVPLQQLLTRGIAVVYDSAVPIAVYGLLFIGAGIVLERVHRRAEGLHRRRQEQLAGLTQRSDEVTRRLDELRGQLAASVDAGAGDEAAPPEIIAEARELEQMTAALRKDVDEVDAELAVMPTTALPRWSDRIPGAVFTVLLPLTLLADPPAFAVGWVVALVVSLLLLWLLDARAWVVVPVALACLAVSEVTAAALSPDRRRGRFTPWQLWNGRRNVCHS